MKKQLLFTASLVLTALTASTADADDRKPGTIQYGTNVLANNSRIEVKWCEPSKDKCDCPGSLGDKNNPTPAAAAPKASCVQMDIPLGRPRYSALAESVMLQLNELLPTSALYSPNGFKVVAGCAVHSVSRDRNVGGVPKWVQLVSPSGLLSAFTFADGESVAKAMSGLAGRSSERLAMVDAQGWATASDPAFYDFYPGDGARWRFGATRAAPDYLQIVEHQAADGRVEAGRDLGLEIIRDADGVLRQVATPGYLADFVVLGPDAYDLSVYPNDASCLSGARTAGGWFGVLDGAVPEVTWKFRNPAPGTCRDLDVTREKAGTEPQTWRYRYVEAVRDFTLTHPGGLKEERLERMASDDGKSWVLRRTESGADGIPFTVKEQHYETGASGDALARTVRDPGGLNLTQRYEYYASGAAAGLEKGSVFEDGSWAGYEYDGAGRLTAEIRPWLDAPINAPAEQCAVTRYAYAPFAPGDFLRFNDQRPRTEVKEVCGVEVSRTYHAYPTNAVGQAQEIEERAAFLGAPYGHASNPRTVKTFYAPSAAVPLAGRLATVVYPGGKTETFGYEYGTFNAATFAFAADPEGGAWRETVTTSYGENSGVQVLRSARVWDGKGREVLDESYVEDGEAFALIGWKRMAYDRSGNLIETAYSDGRVEGAAWGANCCGKESETAADGTTLVYGYNLLKQKVSETKKGMAADGSDDITTLYAYDLEGRVRSTSVTNMASGLGYVVSRHAYDAVGRVTNVTDRLGNPTVTVYELLAVTFSNPNGVTNLTERYSDGQNKRAFENGVVKQSYAYGVVNPDGLRWTLSAQGALPGVAPLASVADLQALVRGLDFPWSFSVSDSLGRTVFEGKPGFGGSALVTSNAYDIAGNLLSATQYAISSVPVNPVILSGNLYSYAADGNRVFTALDLNTNGVIDLEGPDRMMGAFTAYEKDDSNAWWRVSRSWVYPEFNSSAAVTTLVQRFQLTGLGEVQGDAGVLVALSQALDIRGNATSSSTIIDRTARRVMQVTALPTSVQPQVQDNVNGLLQKTVSLTAVTNTFGYDALARRTAATDERGNTSVTGYNQLGLVAYNEDGATNRTSYEYDVLGRRTGVTDALGNVSHSHYDADGRVIHTWGATYPVRYGYDMQGRLVSMMTFRDENGSGDETRWLYDEPTGLLTNKVYADGKGPSYTYIASGKLATITGARGITTAYDYALDGSLLGVYHSDLTHDVSYTYNRVGKVSAVLDASGARVFKHSPDGQVFSDSLTFGALDFSLLEKYDCFGRNTGYALSNSVGLAWHHVAGSMQAYDSYGRIANVVIDGLPVPFIYDYIPGSDLQKSLGLPNGVTREMSYETQRDHVVCVTHTNVLGCILTQRTYCYDEVGRLNGRTQYRMGDVTNSFDLFCYNQRSELTQASLGTNVYTYAFDAIGNRHSAVEPGFFAHYLSNQLNQYTNISGGAVILPTYDAEGNQTLIRTTTGIWYVAYNADNRPVLFSNDTSKVEMTYDYQGRRFEYKETIGGVVNRHECAIYRGNLQIAALDMLADTNVIRTITWDPLVLTANRPLVLHRNNDWWFYGLDQVKNVTELFDSEGGIAATYDYAPFGEVKFSWGLAANINPINFSSEVCDTHFGLSYYNYRHLNHLDGRWLVRDSIEEKGGLLLYGFLQNSVTYHVDIDGRNVCKATVLSDKMVASKTTTQKGSEFSSYVYAGHQNYEETTESVPILLPTGYIMIEKQSWHCDCNCKKQAYRWERTTTCEKKERETLYTCDGECAATSMTFKDTYYVPIVGDWDKKAIGNGGNAEYGGSVGGGGHGMEWACVIACRRLCEAQGTGTPSPPSTEAPACGAEQF